MSLGKFKNQCRSQVWTFQMWGVLNESGKIDKSEMTVGPRIEDRKVQKYVGPRFENFREHGGFLLGELKTQYV